MSTCPVCGQVQNADQSAFAYHVNSHFDAGPSTPMPTPPPIRTSQEKSNINQEQENGTQESCPICDFPLSFLKPTEAETHVNGCLDGPTPSTQAISKRRRPSISTREEEDDDLDLDYDFIVPTDLNLQGNRGRSQEEGVDEGWDGPAKPGGWMDWTGRKVERGDQWWDPLDGSTSDITSNFSPGVIPILAQTLRTSSHHGTTRRAVLCRDVTHIKGIWKFDMGWGCGYRNALMSISSLLSVPTYQSIFDRQNNGAEPGVRRVQGWIQEAWEEGHDPEGRRQLKGKVLGTRKWIGPSDLYAMFTYKGIPCELYDFPKPKDPKDGSRTAHIALQQWVKAYFSDNTEYQSNGDSKSAFDVLMRTQDGGSGRGEVIRITKKFPLILQHSGHSRTIVGYEENSRGDINLLLFDPGRSMPKDIRTTAISHLSQFRRPSLPSPDPEPSSSSFRPHILKKRSSSISATHEPARPFSPPYTNGRAEIDYSTSQFNLALSHQVDPAHPRGGVLPLGDDEEITPSGWVRKKLSKVKSCTANEVGELDVLKTLNYFRVNLGNLSRHTEYQVLAFTGLGVLSASEREKRKVVSSTVVRT
ncbi:hypothetical protein I302_108114 [Kwoniella bestiolae CBS 10118]|uniref:UFSP1/2/DUB catalytic domain-containing protein n=1 Tax=Kwoniella bestiolae CBS 10118 TaxID=1296100 RepID=A0AAJ8KEI8_9TREE